MNFDFYGQLGLIQVGFLLENVYVIEISADCFAEWKQWSFE